MDEKTLISLKVRLARLGLLPLAEALARRILPSGKAARRTEHEMAGFFAQFIRPGDVCFDVGANLGSRIAIFLRLGASVVAVEPQENCVAYLRARYGRDRRVTVIAKGLDTREGERQITISSNDSRMSSMSPEWMDTLLTNTGLDLSSQWDTTVTVPVTTLDRLIETYGRPAFCKIDVEGFEYQVLSGLSSAIPAVSFEFHRVYPDNFRRCITHLLALGEYRFNYCAAETFTFALPGWVSGQQLIDQLTQDSSAMPGSGDIYARLR